MRSGLALAGLLLTPLAAHGQVPGWADLWRVAASTVAGPLALERGPTGMLWNPASVRDLRGLAVGVDVLQTPDVLGIGGVVAAVTQGVGSRVGIGAMVGRLAVQDLVRTTTSPTSRAGTIHVYTQFAALVTGAALGPAHVGVVVRAHDSRFDTAQEGGITADVGIRISPMPALTLAAATHFAEPPFRRGAGTAYFGAAELAITTTTIWGSHFLVIGQYGIAHEERAGLEHRFTAGLALDDRLRVDWGWAREQGYGDASWRSTIALWFRTGRYRIAVARSDGLNGLGASFRLGLNAELFR